MKKYRNVGLIEKLLTIFQESMSLSKVSQLDSCFYVFFSYDEGLNWETFDKDRDYFEILIE